MKGNLKINLLLLLVSLILVLFCAEMIMRFAWKMGGWVQRPIYQRSADPYLRYEFVPGEKTDRIHINSDGFRGPEYSIKKAANTFRIIMLGDSEVFSYMLAESDTLPAQLEKLLNSQPSLWHYEVLNFGVEGYNTQQELEMLKTKGLKYNPDLIILNYVLNDPEPGEYYFNKTFLMRHSALVRYFTYRIKKAMIKKERKKLNIKTEVQHYYYLHQAKYFTPVKDAILEMAEISRKQGKKVVVVIFPTSSIEVKDFRDNYPYRPLHNLIKCIPPDNIIFVDLIEEFNRLGMTPQNVSINYQLEESHKNAHSLKVAANYILNILKSNRLIPE